MMGTTSWITVLYGACVWLWEQYSTWVKYVQSYNVYTVYAPPVGVEINLQGA